MDNRHGTDGLVLENEPRQEEKEMSGTGIFFTVIALGVVGLMFWLLRQLRRAGKMEQELDEAVSSLRAEAKANKMEKDFDEDTERILRELTGGNGNGGDPTRVRSPIHRPPA